MSDNQPPRDDRDDYYHNILMQVCAIIKDGGSLERVEQHLERHGYDCSDDDDSTARSPEDEGPNA